MTKRNNEERLGLPSTGAKGADDPPIETGTPEGALSYVNPTEFVDLPSKGSFYKEGHPLHGKAEVEIREMTAKEEDILSSKSLIQKGVVLDRLLQSVLVDKSINVEDLLVGDKSAILMAVRISGYGEEYETKVTCPGCSSVSKHSFDLNECEVRGPFSPETCKNEKVSSAITETPDGAYLVNLPRSKAQVEIIMLTGKEEKKIVAHQEMRRKKKLPENILTTQFKILIQSVDGSTEAHQVASFIDKMPALDSRFLRKVIVEISPNIDLTQEFVCEECGYEQDMGVPISADFFWPEQ
jgi:hypothetical protein